MCNKETKKILCIISNILFSYTINFFCIYFIINYVMWNDLYYNQQYSHESYDDSTYIKKQDSYILAILGVYWVNALQTTCLGYKYSRHFIFLNVHIIMYSLFYIILVLQSIKNKSCEQRYLFTCYENSTIYEIDDSGLENSIKVIGYFIAWLLVMSILMIIYMIHDNNYKRIYYLSTKNILEFFGLIITYHIVTYCYIGIPIIIICVIFSDSIRIPNDFTFLNGRIMNSIPDHSKHETNQFVKSSPTHGITYTDKNKYI